VAEVGCATHSYTITDRNGTLVASSGTLLEVSYNRVLNDASTALAVVGVTDPKCCAQLGNIRSWRYLLNIYRGREFMWSGLIVNIEWSRDEVQVRAVDLIGLLERRVPHQDFTYDGTDLATIAKDLVDDGLAPDDPGHETTIIGLSGVLGGREYERNVGQTADHLRDLADTGIDFTTVGNNILILPDDFCEVVGLLSDDDLPEGLTVAEDGGSLVTRQIVAGSEESEALGTAGGANDYYGLLEYYEEQSSITTQAAAEAAAQARLAASAVAPVFIDTRNITLRPTAAVDVQNLVPGWCLDITSYATCRRISQRLKLTGLQITENGGSPNTPGQERILLQVTGTGDQLVVN
jgi:hypothetical protein